MTELKSINQLWKSYNDISNDLSSKLGRTNNIVGEFGEHLAFKYYGGELLECSSSSADLKDNNEKLYQVKTRKLNGLTSSQLGIIRSWEFHYLVVIIFDSTGSLLKGLEVPVDVAKEYGKENNYQNGWVITTSQDFLEDKRSNDITEGLNVLLENRNYIDGFDNYYESGNTNVLPIEFTPSDLGVFKQLLLKSKEAKITIFYNGNTKDSKIWKANRFSETSDLIRNLRSREEFRQGKWQDSNIRYVKVEINN
jgi:hypothetical protein